MITLRDYQERALDQLNQWFENNATGNPVLDLCTGAGKSHIVAAFCKRALQAWPDTRVLMLTHQKELIEQNAEKMRQHWKGAPLGIYSASLNRKTLGEPITFAGIQSIINQKENIGHIDLILIDECHMISHKNQGSYRVLIDHLATINPRLRVIGLTATPYRLGQGYLTDGEDALFSDIISPVTIEELVFKGFLATLRSKCTQAHFDTDTVKKRGGEYVENELQAIVDTPLNNQEVVSEVIKLAGDRRSWLFFCVGVEHAQNISACLNDRGIVADCVTGKTSKSERERIIADFKEGKIKALTNANVLTTGFDFPGIDLIAMLRPTMSTALYVQMAGRGLRPKQHTDHCLVLDFAGNISRLGPITNPLPPLPPGKKRLDIEPPVKDCPECAELVHPSVRSCPCCGYEWPKKEIKHKLSDDDIMSRAKVYTMKVSRWVWSKHTSKKSGSDCLKVTYYGVLSDAPVSEYFSLFHHGYAQKKAIEKIRAILEGIGASYSVFLQKDTIEDMARFFNVWHSQDNPEEIKYEITGKFATVTSREFKVKKNYYTV